jgi:hypothetical protein
LRVNSVSEETLKQYEQITREMDKLVKENVLTEEERNKAMDAFHNEMFSGKYESGSEIESILTKIEDAWGIKEERVLPGFGDEKKQAK